MWRNGQVWALAAALLLGACSDDITGGSGKTPGERTLGPNRDDTGDTKAVRRVGLDIRATGAFRPGTPISITSTARARHAASDVDYTLVLLDDDNAVVGGGAAHALASSRGALAKGAQKQLAATVTFAQPGYYRVAAIANSQPPAGEGSVAGDTALIDGSSETLYILVDENGGKLTNGYDRAALAGRLPRYGAFGAFAAGRGAPAASRALRAPDAPRQQVTSTRGVFRYYNRDSGTYRAVPNAQVSVSCLNSSFAVVNTLTTTTASDGTFSFSCAYGYYDASIALRNRIAEVVSPGRVNAGVDYFNESNGAAPSLLAANDYAAHAHVLLNQYIPIAESRFGYSRTRIPVIMSATDSTFPINYNQTQDTIRLNYTRVFTEDGRFVTIHEYGHAYHYVAIEPWSNYYCSASGEHFIDRQYSYSCALVEGFATFFSVYVAGDSLTSTYYSDYKIETQTFYTGKDGAQVEGAVAGFLYDVVDGTASPDGPNNETGSDESTFDGVSYPASFVAGLMRNCELVTGTSTITRFDGIDELVYCLEGNTTAGQVAASLGYPGWIAADSVRRNVTVPAGFDPNAIRRLWRRNLYGQ